MDRDTIVGALRPGVLGREVEHYQVALTTESIALGWLRQRGAGHGAVVVADREIAARGRRFEEWTSVDGLAASVIVKPELPVDRQDLLWAHGLLAARAAYATVGIRVAPHWPEALLVNDTPMGLVKAESQLGPRGVASAVLTFRFDVTGVDDDGDSRLVLLAALLEALEVRLAQPPQAISEEFAEHDPLVGTQAVVQMLPRGSIRGTAVGIDNIGAFGVAGTSGHVTRLPVDQIRSIERPHD
ncbi:MAG: hypothetical protein HKN91_14055 [Acidimicrobiia bacterium]|nr:hypothetical protein [Acidimicrobiia bacterium]